MMKNFTLKFFFEGKIIFSKKLKTYSESIPHVPPDDFFENVISTISTTLHQNHGFSADFETILPKDLYGGFGV